MNDMILKAKCKQGQPDESNTQRQI